ncbi:MAG: gluconate 5-dehydrogenase [Planctomycetota bacterium]|nr:MAG: gluconate 5-dehydrogenase [Planctomycetota bacterium]
MSQKGLFSLSGKVAVVTGGYGHLGKSFCNGLADAGASVVVAGPNCDKFKRAFGKGRNRKITFEQMDVSSEESVKTAFKHIYKKTKRIDILVNNAVYLQRSGKPAEMSSSDWNYGVDGTLNSVFRCIKLVVPYMKRAKKGSIINISSMYGVVSPDFSIYRGYKKQFSQPNYGAAKAGVIQLTRYYAVYLARYGIRVNCISPGAFPNPNIVKQKRFLQKLSAKIPIGRVGRPDELEGAIVFLASVASSYMTGQNVIIDGGWTAW